MKNVNREEILVRETVRSFILESLIEESMFESNDIEQLNEMDMKAIKDGFSALKDFFSGNLEKLANGAKQKLEKVQADIRAGFSEPMKTAQEIIKVIKDEGINIPSNKFFEASKKLHELGPMLDVAGAKDTATGGAVEKQVEKIASGDEVSQAVAMESYRRTLRRLHESLDSMDETLRVQKALKVIQEAIEILAVAASVFAWWMGLLAIVSGCYLISKGIYLLCKWLCGENANSTKVAKSFADAFHAVEIGLKDITVPDAVSFPIYKALRKAGMFKEDKELSFTEYASSKSREALEKWLFFALLIFSLVEAVQHLAHAIGWLSNIVYGSKTAVKGTEAAIQTGEAIASAIGSGASVAEVGTQAGEAAVLAGEAISLIA